MQNDKSSTQPIAVNQDRRNTQSRGTELTERQLVQVQGGSGPANPRRPL